MKRAIIYKLLILIGLSINLGNVSAQSQSEVKPVESSIFDDYIKGYYSQVFGINITEILNTDLYSVVEKWLGTPYKYAGKSLNGIDCSGFTQLIYKLNGYQLLRDASQQVEIGTPLSFVEEAEAGDLAFFDNEEGNIVHVGMVLENQQIIHASGCVRIDKFDHYGIFHSDNKKYSHMLRVIKKII